MNNRTSLNKITIAGVFLIIGMLIEIVNCIIRISNYGFAIVLKNDNYNLLPNLLLLLYVFCFYKRNSGNILLPVSFLLSTFLEVRTIFLDMYHKESIIFIIMPMIILFFSIMSTIGAFFGFKSFFNKKVVYLWSTFTILHIILYRVLFGMPVSLFLYIINYANILFFHIGIVILVKNGYFEKVTLKRNIVHEAVDLEKLKEQYEAGVITEEDYNEKRNNILKSL